MAKMSCLSVLDYARCSLLLFLSIHHYVLLLFFVAQVCWQAYFVKVIVAIVMQLQDRQIWDRH